jgi:2-keto-4-pentenoate hydratase/2-oxohepta-3-ene-1,7-dioic acid hydratase in catechol pathway
MRYVSMPGPDGPRAALVRDGRAYAFDRSLDVLVAEGALGSAEPANRDGVPIEAATLLAPLASPGKIVCIGQNYHAHAAEQGTEAPKLPTFFAKFQNALAPPGATVKLPDWSRVDYEAEVAFVIGTAARTCRRRRRCTTWPATRC